jgi:hypothetical protein
MKKIKLFSILSALVILSACDKDDENINNVYDETTDQVGIGFTTPEVLTVCGWTTGTSAGVRSNGASMRIGVETTAKTNEDRTFNILVNSNLSTGESGHYVIENATILAGSYTTTVNIDFIDDGTLDDGVSYKLALEIEIPEGSTSHTSNSITLSYNKFQFCNNYTLTMNEVDGWGSERTWKVTNSDDVVVATGGPYADGAQVFTANMTLQDGLHTLTMYDSFGDGNSNGNEDQEGNFSLDCGITNAAYEKGDWGSEISKDFCVNP